VALPGRGYGLIMPKKLQQKNLASSKLSVFADDSDDEVSSAVLILAPAHRPFVLFLYLWSFCSHQSFLPWPCRDAGLSSPVLKFVCMVSMCFYRRGLKYLFLPADIKTTSFVLWKNSLSALRVRDRLLSLRAFNKWAVDK
uniref:Uncharacterized protein n=1 Tax=Coturnix japonica TaxID=93934 RepID=A0A8C2TPM7_COTJA